MSIARTSQVHPYSTNHNHHYHNKYAPVAVLQPPYIKQEECGAREESRCKEGGVHQGGFSRPAIVLPPALTCKQNTHALDRADVTVVTECTR